MCNDDWLKNQLNAFKEGKLETVEKELAKGVGDEELGIALMWASSAGKVNGIGYHMGVGDRMGS